MRIHANNMMSSCHRCSFDDQNYARQECRLQNIGTRQAFRHICLHKYDTWIMFWWQWDQPLSNVFMLMYTRKGPWVKLSWQMDSVGSTSWLTLNRMRRMRTCKNPALLQTCRSYTAYSLALHFLREVHRTDGTDEDYQVGMEIMKNECQNIIDVLQNCWDSMTHGTIDDLHPTSSWSCRRRITIPGLDANPDRRLAYWKTYVSESI